MGEPARQLSRERVLQAAVGIADAHGLGALTMRSLAAELNAKPMSLYHYIRSKDELLDALVDGVFAEIELPEVGGDWRAEVRRRSSRPVRSSRGIPGR